ncbi:MULTISPECIES: hypothetical protein [unclassified Mycobacterium]|uniref:hypothetical protein n=1 Tax=unclassified Mycobacterium TaxID=2642494 RepID=UPI0029C7A52B|nr:MULTISPECIES: hypothetical protein [unclassified Mycobacterium]
MSELSADVIAFLCVNGVETAASANDYRLPKIPPRFQVTPPPHMCSSPTPNPHEEYGPTTGGGEVLIDVLPPGREQMVVVALVLVQVRSSAPAGGAMTIPTATVVIPTKGSA